MNNDFKPSADNRGDSIAPRAQNVQSTQSSLNQNPTGPAVTPSPQAPRAAATQLPQTTAAATPPAASRQPNPAQVQNQTRGQTPGGQATPATPYDETIEEAYADDGSAGTPPSLIKRIAGKFSRKQWIMIASGLILVVGGGLSYALTRPDTTQSSVVTAPKPAPKPVEPPLSPLTGVVTGPQDVGRVVTGVMIENSTNARPQSGLSQAGVVFEAIAEYGITRFLALYQEDKPANMGPVRSVRPYYVDWARSFDAPIAHVGGSPDALRKIKTEGVKDLDQFYNAQAYRRVSNRVAPHNVYTTTDNLNKVELSKGWGGSSFTGFARKKPSEVKAPTAPPTAKSVNIAISGPTYNVHYDYDAASNSYKRVMAGAPHIDAGNNAQISPNVVIGLVTAYGLESDGYHSKYQITGSNTAFVFQDGAVTQVTWKRDASNSQYVFTDASGKPFKLNPGRTWITVVGTPGAVTYAP